MPDCDAIVPAAYQTREIFRDRVVDACDGYACDQARDGGLIAGLWTDLATAKDIRLPSAPRRQAL